MKYSPPKKSISPVVATALLLVVAVGAVIGFQTWFQTYQAGINTKIESQNNNFDTQIANLIGTDLYFRSGKNNLTITDVKIGGISCNISKSLILGMNKIDLNKCSYSTNSILKDVQEVVVLTGSQIYSKKYLVNNLALCQNNWIPVKGNSILGTTNFCVMKYEAKNVGGVATSQAAGLPWVSLTWQQAKANCSNLGNNYNLISDDQWLSIAKIAEKEPSNWNSSIVGNGFMYSGHNDNGPANSLSISNVNDPYDQTGQSTGSNQRRTLNISGNMIWDLSGNVWEWTDFSLPIASRYHGGDQQWMTYDNDGGLVKASFVPTLKLPSNNWDADNGMGRYYDGFSLAGAYNSLNEAPDFCIGYCSSTAVGFRGGHWSSGAYAGAFALTLNRGPSGLVTSVGFRCSFS